MRELREIAVLKRVLLTLAVLALAGAAYLTGIALDLYGVHEDAGTIAGERIPAEIVQVRQRAQSRAAEALGVRSPAKQILFGDLHAHTTFSKDAFLGSLPLIQGEGAHPPADACDFARHCAALDFWGIADHAESLTPRHWQASRSGRQYCRAPSRPPGLTGTSQKHIRPFTILREPPPCFAPL